MPTCPEDGLKVCIILISATCSLVISAILLAITEQDATVKETWVRNYFIALYCTQLMLLLLLLTIARCIQLVFGISPFGTMMKRWWTTQGKKHWFALLFLYIATSTALISLYPLVGYFADCHGWLVNPPSCVYPINESAFTTARILFVTVGACLVIVLFGLALCPCRLVNDPADPDPDDEEAQNAGDDDPLISESVSTDPDESDSRGSDIDDDVDDPVDQTNGVVVEMFPPRLIRSE